jgi:hypothetical protein
VEVMNCLKDLMIIHTVVHICKSFGDMHDSLCNDASVSVSKLLHFLLYWPSLLYLLYSSEVPVSHFFFASNGV